MIKWYDEKRAKCNLKYFLDVCGKNFSFRYFYNHPGVLSSKCALFTVRQIKMWKRKKTFNQAIFCAFDVILKQILLLVAWTILFWREIGLQTCVYPALLCFKFIGLKSWLETKSAVFLFHSFMVLTVHCTWYIVHTLTYVQEINVVPKLLLVGRSTWTGRCCMLILLSLLAHR